MCCRAVRRVSPRSLVPVFGPAHGYDTSAHHSSIPDSTSRLGVELLSTKTSVDKGQLLTDNQLATAIRGFEEGGFKEAKHAAGIISRGKTTEEVWEATREHLLDVLEEASVVGSLDEDPPRAACQAARVVAKTSSNTSIDPPTKTNLGESLIRDGTSDDGNPWLTTAGIFLLSAAMETTDYDPADEFAKRIAEHLLAVSKKTDGTREANLAAAGYSVLGRMSEGDHARMLVAEGVDIRQYLLRTESNFGEGFVRFAARLAEEDPGFLEPYTVELATHLRADSYTVRRDAARAFAALCGEVDWETLRPGTITLDGPFENDGPMVPLFALQFLQRVAVHKPEVIPRQVGEAFVRALRRDEQFTSLYGSEGAIAEDMGARAMLFYVLETLDPDSRNWSKQPVTGCSTNYWSRARRKSPRWCPLQEAVSRRLTPRLSETSLCSSSLTVSRQTKRRSRWTHRSSWMRRPGPR